MGRNKPNAGPRPRTQRRSPWLGDPPSVACGHTEGDQPVCGPSCSPTCETAAAPEAAQTAQTPEAAQTPGARRLLGCLRVEDFETLGVLELGGWEFETTGN